VAIAFRVHSRRHNRACHRATVLALVGPRKRLTYSSRGNPPNSATRFVRILWAHNSPTWHFDVATFDRSAQAFDNPDYVEVVIHSYRHRLGLAAGYPPYEELEKRLAAQPTIIMPTITLDGDADGILPATNGKSTAAKFVGERQHRVIANVGHDLPQENPAAFAAAVWELASRKR
jgi:pimeloyl-ACP methyl ester carboxylesterase